MMDIFCISYIIAVLSFFFMVFTGNNDNDNEDLGRLKR